MLCEAAAYYKLQGKTLCDALSDIFAKYGYYFEVLDFIVLKGSDGAAKIQSMMKSLRENPVKEIGGLKVEAVRDYQNDTRTVLATGEKEPTGLPESDVLYYELERNAWLAVRPSGTEPKIKFYYGVNEPDIKSAYGRLAAIKGWLDTLGEQ